MLRLLILSLTLAWASLASAAVTFTCTRTTELIQANGVLVVGNCAASGTVTAGGDAVGATAAFGDAGLAICGSSARAIKEIVLGADVTATPNALVLTYDLSTFKVSAFTAAAVPGATVNLVAATGATATGTFRYVAFCQ